MEPLRALFQHHAWATLRLIDHCAALPPEQLESTVPGTPGPVALTLRHLVAADQRYLRSMDGQEPGVEVRESVPATLAQLRSAMELQAGRWQALVDRATELDVSLPAGGGDPEVPHGGEVLVFLQAIHHGNDHRTHVCTILGALDLEVPDLSGWEFWRAERVPAS